MIFPCTFIDQMNHQIMLQEPPKRIISLVPSQTELLFELGLGNRIVGITKFCIYPKELVKQKTKIGGTKSFNFDLIDQLQPDLIIGNKEENYKEGIEKLQQRYPVWLSDIFNLDGSLEMMQQLGELTGTQQKAAEIIHNIKTGFSNLVPATQSVSTAYFIWRKPFMAVGNNNIIDHMLQLCGFKNAFGHLSRYPEVTPELLQEANPQLILLSSEPYPFKEKHIEEFQHICQQAMIKVVDGEMFSWYGSRLLQAPTYLQGVIDEIKAIYK